MFDFWSDLLGELAIVIMPRRFQFGCTVICLILVAGIFVWLSFR